MMDMVALGVMEENESEGVKFNDSSDFVKIVIFKEIPRTGIPSGVYTV